MVTRSEGAYCILDGENRIRFCSPGMEKLTGWPADQLEELICGPSVAATAEPVELFVAGIAPATDVRKGIPQSVNVLLPTKSGQGLRTTLTFFPVLDESSVVTRIIVLILPMQQTSNVAPSLAQKLHAEITSLRLEFRRRFSEPMFLGRSPAICKALEQADLLKQSDCGYSIVGPSGSGRRHLARLIHTSGQKNDSSFVALECRLLTAEQVLDSLRHLRRTANDSGGAAHQRIGTLLLLDADRCPRELQTWLLSDGWTELDGVRMVSVSENPLADPKSSEWILPEFRDLFSTLQIHLPALHHRGSDISILAQHFIEECHHSLETSAESMSSDVEQALRFYRWPGNVRELKRVIVEACQNSFTDCLASDDLPFAFRAGQDAQDLPHIPEQSVQSLEEIMQRFETDVILSTLRACSGNKAEAARRLGMTRPRLYRRLRTLGIDDEEDGRAASQ